MVLLFSLILLAVGCSEAPQPDSHRSAAPASPALSEKGAPVLKLYPVDESHLDPSFVDFKARLLQAVERRDLDFILRIAHSSIALGSPEDFPNPRESLRRLFQPTRYESGMWQELRQMLLLGAVQTEGEFCAPYIHAKFPRELDPFEYLVITGENVRVRAEPSLTAEAIDTLSYDIVKLDSIGYTEPVETIAGERHRWWRVLTPSGRTGHIWGKYARQPIDYEVCFKKIEGKWMMTSLVSYSD
jgi:hypothetical protein